MPAYLTIPRMKHVTSSNIDAVGYNPDTSELHVRFRNGTHYVYRSVGEETHKLFLKTQSPGKFFAEHVRSKFSFFQVPKEP